MTASGLVSSLNISNLLIRHLGHRLRRRAPQSFLPSAFSLGALCACSVRIPSQPGGLGPYPPLLSSYKAPVAPCRLRPWRLFRVCRRAHRLIAAVDPPHEARTTLSPKTRFCVKNRLYARFCPSHPSQRRQCARPRLACLRHLPLLFPRQIH